MEVELLNTQLPTLQTNEQELGTDRAEKKRRSETNTDDLSPTTGITKGK